MEHCHALIRAWILDIITRWKHLQQPPQALQAPWTAGWRLGILIYWFSNYLDLSKPCLMLASGILEAFTDEGFQDPRRRGFSDKAGLVLLRREYPGLDDLYIVQTS